MSARIISLPSRRRGNPRAENRYLPPRRPVNRAVRSREYLTPDEVEKLIAAAKSVGRQGHRDATMILLAYRHALRVSELVALRSDQIDLKHGLIYVHRLKNGTPSVHPIRGPEIRALRRLERDYPETPYSFEPERRGPLTASTARKVIARAGRLTGLPFPVRPHMLRHACGYKLANDRQDTRAIRHYLGHKNITHTSRYADLAPHRFSQFWKD